MKFTKSIHWRLLLWIAFLLGLVLLALDFTGYEIYFYQPRRPARRRIAAARGSDERERVRAGTAA